MPLQMQLRRSSSLWQQGWLNSLERWTWWLYVCVYSTIEWSQVVLCAVCLRVCLLACRSEAEACRELLLFEMEEGSEHAFDGGREIIKSHDLGRGITRQSECIHCMPRLYMVSNSIYIIPITSTSSSSHSVPSSSPSLQLFPKQ